jgi:hypothetical protein
MHVRSQEGRGLHYCTQFQRDNNIYVFTRNKRVELRIPKLNVVGTSAIPLTVQKVKAPRLFGQLNMSKEKLKNSFCFPKLTYYWFSCRPTYTCGSLRLHRCILPDFLSGCCFHGRTTRPARRGASPELRPGEELKILSCFLQSLFPPSLPLLRQPSEGGGGCHVQRSQMDYTSEIATFPQFWHVGATPRQTFYA